ncbi:unnamed protein product [Knipowitschia caucasica]
MAGSSNNSWTIVSPEESAAAETLRPLTERAERQDEPSAPTDGVGTKPSDGPHGLTEEDHLKSEEPVVEDNEDVNASSLCSSAPSESHPHPPTGGAVVSTLEPESFSDSYSDLGPSADTPAETPTETAVPPLSTETLGRLDPGPEEEVREQTEVQDRTQTVREEEEEEEAQQEMHESSPIDAPQDPSVQTESLEPELRRRRLVALEQIGHDDEQEVEEEFQLPQREQDSGITLNKCILGAVILLGLGTIFISGVLVDLDEESDSPSGELRESESSGKQEWLTPDVSQPGVKAETAEFLSTFTQGNEQIEMLQAQVQNEELKVAKAQAAEGSTERLGQQELQRENSRLKKEVQSVSLLQKELERMRTELDSVPTLQREVQALWSTLTQMKLSAAAATTPPSGRTEHSIPEPAEHNKDKQDRGVTKEWKDAEKANWKKEKQRRKDGGKTGGKESDKDKYDGGKYEKRHKHDKQGHETREWKKDKSKKGDEGMSYKEKKEKKEWPHEADKKHKKFEKGKDGRDFKESKYNQEKPRGSENKHWKKEGDGHKEEKYDKRPWKERDGNGGHNRKASGEGKEHSKDQKKWVKYEKKEWKNGKEDRIVVEKSYRKAWDAEKSAKHDEKSKTTKPAPASSQVKPAVGQPEYWSRQRARIQHSAKTPPQCDSPDSCAHAQGLRPVALAEFEAILSSYLSKAQAAGVEASQADELRKLAAEMFENGAFPHDRTSFEDYVEDVGDVLEDLVEAEEDGADSAVEDEMEGFEREVMQKFMLLREKDKVRADLERKRTRG